MESESGGEPPGRRSIQANATARERPGRRATGVSSRLCSNRFVAMIALTPMRARLPLQDINRGSDVMRKGETLWAVVEMP